MTMTKQRLPTTCTVPPVVHSVRLCRRLDESHFPDATGKASTVLFYDLELPFAPYPGLEVSNGTAWSASLTQVSYDLAARRFECTAEHVYLLEDLDTIAEPALSLFEHEVRFYRSLGWQEQARSGRKRRGGGKP